MEVLDFIFSSPKVPPDEEQVAPTLVRLVWEVQRTFNWTHSFHRSLYDLFAADEVADKQAAYERILRDYLSKPEAITSHPLDHHGKLWSWPESKTFRDKFRKFNTQIWAYHWLQAAAYDVQLMGPAARQRELMPRIIEHYHGYLRNAPEQWQMMPMTMEVAPEFTMNFPEAANIFDNLHMLHDNLDDILSRPDLYPTHDARREQILKVLEIYLHRNHVGSDRFAEYHAKMQHAGGTDAMHQEHRDAEHFDAQPQRDQQSHEHTAHGKIGDEIPPGRHHTADEKQQHTRAHIQPGVAQPHEQHGDAKHQSRATQINQYPMKPKDSSRQEQMQSPMSGMEHMGPRPPSARAVLEGRTGDKIMPRSDKKHQELEQSEPQNPKKPAQRHSGENHKH